MFSLHIYCLLWITLIHEEKCAVIRLDHNKRMKDGLEYVMQKYLNPLRKLTADLPNHAIEMQIEIHDSIPNSTKQNPHRRLIRVINSHHPKSVKRSQDVSSVASVVPEVEPVKTASASSETTTPGSSSAATSDPSKLPVYMDDLKKALDELEKKIIGTGESAATMTTSDNLPCNGGSQSNGAPPVRNIDDIVQLLKKAITIERQIPPQPNDPNLDWVQLKIPKNI